MPPESSNAPGKGASQSPGEGDAPNDGRSVDPPRVQLNVEGIPPELRALPHWVSWKLTPPKKPGGKFGKVPIDPKTGGLASTTSATTWGSFEDALARMQRDGLAGIGFVFTDSGYVGVDLDHCRNPEPGGIEAWAQSIVDALASYTEISPSGTGLHIIARGKLPGKGRRRANTEVYDTGRFFTITGVLVPGAPPRIFERQAALDEVYARLGDEQPRSASTSGTPADDFADIDDDELVRRASAAKNGAKFRGLWSGSTEGYSSASEADLALCCLLSFWTRCKADAIDRLFRRSGLFRLKWEERHGEQTYGELTIEKAMSSARTTRSESREPDSGNEPAGVGIPLTDTGNAERLVERFGADLRFCHSWKKWLVWDGRRWRADERGALMAMSKRIARSILAEAAKCDDSALRDEITKWAKGSEKVDRRKAMVELAKCESKIPIYHEQLDQHPMLLNCANGTIDLGTGEWYPHRREQGLTKLCSTRYLPDAACPRFLEFLERVLPDPEAQQYMQRYFGYSLTGDTSEQQVLIAAGEGLNGKSTLFCAIQDVVGRGYAIQISPDLVLTKDFAAHPTELADLFGVRLAIGTETPKGRALNETLVKQLTGGEPIRARRMREDFWEFRPTHKLVLVTNDMPKVSIDSFAMLRRLHVVPFEVRIQKDEIDKRLPRKLRDEREGILAWCIRGSLLWRERGLDPPPGVLFQPTPGAAARKQPVEEFIALYVVRRPGARTGATAAYTAFVEWCGSDGITPCSQNEFGSALGREGFGKRKSEGVTVYLDMALSWPGSPIRGPSGMNGDHSPVDPPGAPHEEVNGEEVPKGPQRSPEPEQPAPCRACAGTRFWRRAGSSTEWFCARCAPPMSGIEIEVRDV